MEHFQDRKVVPRPCGSGFVLYCCLQSSPWIYGQCHQSHKIHIVRTSCHLCGLNRLSVQLNRPAVVLSPSPESRATRLSWELSKCRNIHFDQSTGCPKKGPFWIFKDDLGDQIFWWLWSWSALGEEVQFRRGICHKCKIFLGSGRIKWKKTREFFLSSLFPVLDSCLFQA